MTVMRMAHLWANCSENHVRWSRVARCYRFHTHHAITQRVATEEVVMGSRIRKLIAVASVGITSIAVGIVSLGQLAAGARAQGAGAQCGMRENVLGKLKEQCGEQPSAIGVAA
jgi:hypothetical protein